MTRLDPILRRGAAVALACAVPAAIWLLACRPVLDTFAATDDRIAVAADRVQRYRAAAVGGEGVEARLARLQRRMQDGGGQMRGDSEGIAVAGLQARLKKAVADAGGELKSMQALPGRDGDGMRRITVRVAFAGSAMVLRDVLRAIETDTPFVFADNLDVRARTSREAGAAAADVTLEIRLDAYGLMEPKAPAGES